MFKVAGSTETLCTGMAAGSFLHPLNAIAMLTITARPCRIVVIDFFLKIMVINEFTLFRINYLQGAKKPCGRCFGIFVIELL